MKASQVLVIGGLTALLTACAAHKHHEPKAPTESPAEYDSTPSSGGAAPDQPGYPSAPAPPPLPQPAMTPLTPSRQAGADLERAQRELDVAAGDCMNACRALGSMDRAAGRICTLSSGSDDDKQRCSDAKTRVYSARDKVKSSCGQCNETSVDKNAPVPSR